VTGFLARLVARAAGAEAGLEPRPRNRFAERPAFAADLAGVTDRLRTGFVVEETEAADRGVAQPVDVADAAEAVPAVDVPSPVAPPFGWRSTGTWPTAIAPGPTSPRDLPPVPETVGQSGQTPHDVSHGDGQLMPLETTAASGVWLRAVDAGWERPIRRARQPGDHARSPLRCPSGAADSCGSRDAGGGSSADGRRAHRPYRCARGACARRSRPARGDAEEPPARTVARRLPARPGTEARVSNRARRRRDLAGDHRGHRRRRRRRAVDVAGHPRLGDHILCTPRTILSPIRPRKSPTSTCFSTMSRTTRAGARSACRRAGPAATRSDARRSRSISTIC
jgi:hypothetical protein